MKTLSLFSIVIFISCSIAEPTKHEIIQRKPLYELIDELNLSKSNLSVLVDKSDYTLQVTSNSHILRTYPVVLGSNPIDQKLMQGDRCTPEGVFHIRDLYPHNRWSKFIWFDYPNDQSRENHRLAKQKWSIPENATIGGEVGIHGVPENCDYYIDEKINWTWGCIALTTVDIEDLYRCMQKGTQITIQP